MEKPRSEQEATSKRERAREAREDKLLACFLMYLRGTLDPPIFSLQHPPFPCVLLSSFVSLSPPLRVHLITHFLYCCLPQAPVLCLEKVDWSHYTSEIVFVLVFIVVKNTKHDVYLLNRFLGIQYGIVNCRYNIVQQIPRTYFA